VDESGPTATEEGRRRIAERLKTSERLRSALRGLGYDPNETARLMPQRASLTDDQDT